MINVLLNTYAFHASWAMEHLKQILHPMDRVCVLTMSHGDEIPDGGTWKHLYSPGGKIYQDLSQAFVAYGIPEENILFVSWFHDTPESALLKLGAADILFLTGGLPDVFMERIDEMGLTEPIRCFPGVIMGCSAGAMLQMTEYHITPDEDYDAFGYYMGLGLLDGFEPEVHYAATDVQLASINRYQAERNKTVYATSNEGGLLIQNGNIFPMGQVTVFPISSEDKT